MYNDINSALIFLAITRNVYIKKSGHAHVQDNQTKTVYLFFQTALDWYPELFCQIMFIFPIKHFLYMV